MKIQKSIQFLTFLLVFSFVSCDVDQTRSTQLPEVDVDVTDGQLPAFDVDWAEVNVGTRTEKVTVPTVKIVMEEMEVEVPYINVDMPDENGKEELTVAVEAEVGGTAHSLEIVEVVASQKRLYVISKLEPTGKNLGSERIRVTDRLILNAPDLDIKHYIIGKRPSGQFNKQFSYIANKNAISDKLKNGKTIYSK